AVALVSAMASGNPLNPRYAIVAFPALVLVVGAGVARLGALVPSGRGALVAGGALFAVAVVSGRSLYNLAYDPRYAKEDCRDLGALLARDARADDVVIVSARYMDSPVRFYYDGPAEIVGYDAPGGAVDDSRAT